MKNILIITAILLQGSLLSAQKEGIESINQSDLRSYMTFFASDEMKGRETGSPQNEIAAQFLRTSAMRIGLKPVPLTGEYFQKVPLVSTEIKGGETYLKAKDISGNELYSSDSVVYLMAPSNTVEMSSHLVFAGYGFRDTASGYDDLQGIDPGGKIVMIMTGSPEVTEQDNLDAIINIDIERSKIISLMQKGASAILYVYDPGSPFSDAYASGLADMGAARPGSKFMALEQPDDVTQSQIAFITRYAANSILSRSGQTLETLQEKIISEKKPVSFESDEVEITFRTFIEMRSFSMNNVIGIIEGSDPVLKNECIIYTAHYDHVGVDKNGEAFNGADDNASGSMALLEVAQAYMSLKKKPLRTIVFAWVNGEEKGLLGSQYYVRNPVYNLDKTLLNINLDMVGRSKMPSDTGKVFGFDVNVSGKGEIQMYTDQKGKDFLDIVSRASKAAGIKALNLGRDPQLGSSDYAPFMAKDVPAVFFNSGDYPDLHTIRDDVEKIDFDKMERVSKMVFLLGFDIANQKKRFVPDTIESPEM